MLNDNFSAVAKKRSLSHAWTKATFLGEITGNVGKFYGAQTVVTIISVVYYLSEMLFF